MTSWVGEYGSNWISFAWDSANQDYGAPQTPDDPLVPGQGNWHYSTSPGLMLLEGDPTPVEPCPASMAPAANCFRIPLTVDGNGLTRWNLIGNPFPVAVNWADVRISVDGQEFTPSEAEAAGIFSKTFYSWNGNSYDAYDDVTSGMTGRLQPQNSGWGTTLPNTNATAIDLWVPRP